MGGVVLSVINQKGGVGKTTLSLNLASILSSQKQKVLLVDFDPQGHSTLGCGFNKNNLDQTVFDLLDQGYQSERWQQAVRPLSEYFDLLPANIVLSSFEQKLAGQKDREFYLKNLLNAVKDYDFILIDSPPNLGLLTINVLLASQYVVAPVELSPFGLDGLAALQSTLTLLEDRLNHQVDYRIFLNRFDARLSLSKTLKKYLNSTLQSKLFKSNFSTSIRFVENQNEGTPLNLNRLGKRNLKALIDLASEIKKWAKPRSIKKIIEPSQTEKRQPTVTLLRKATAEVVHEPVLYDSHVLADEGVLFTYVQWDAQKVSLVGEFNDWDPDANPMTRVSAEGAFSCFVYLKPGQYQYKFLVDDHWQLDPNNPQKKSNGEGVINSVIQVSA